MTSSTAPAPRCFSCSFSGVTDGPLGDLAAYLVTSLPAEADAENMGAVLDLHASCAAYARDLGVTLVPTAR